MYTQVRSNGFTGKICTYIMEYYEGLLFINNPAYLI